MSLRRLVYLIILASAGWLWYLGTNALSATMLGPVLVLSAFLVGIPALLGLIFNLTLLGRPQPDSGFGVLSERQGTAFGSWLVLLFGALLLLAAVKGVVVGHMPSIGLEADVHFSRAPFHFVLTWLAWVSAGLGLVWLSRKVGRRNRRD
jgi:hypothetical protein